MSRRARLAAPAPAAPLARAVGRQLWHDLPALLAVNARFLLWGLPYALLALVGLPGLALAVLPLTLGPGLVGLWRGVARLGRDGTGVTRRAGRPARGARLAGALAVALGLGAWHAQLLALRAVVEHDGAPAAVLLWAAQLAVLLACALVGVHGLTLVALYGQAPLEALRNAAILAVRGPGATLGMLGLVGAAAALTWTLGGAPLIIVPAAVALVLVRATGALVEAGDPC